MWFLIIKKSSKNFRFSGFFQVVKYSGDVSIKENFSNVKNHNATLRFIFRWIRARIFYPKFKGKLDIYKLRLITYRLLLLLYDHVRTLLLLFSYKYIKTLFLFSFDRVYIYSCRTKQNETISKELTIRPISHRLLSLACFYSTKPSSVAIL